MKFSKRNSTVVGFAAVSLVVMTLLATATIVASIPRANAEGNGPPVVHIGNPHNFQPGPPIPSCNAEPSNPTAGGCKVTP